MKKIISSLIIGITLYLGLPSELLALPVDNEAANTIEKIVEEYLKKNPRTGMKKGLCVLPFAEDSAIAKEAGLGSTIRDIMSAAISQSQIFFLIDRDTLSNRMREMELSMTGVIDEKSIISAGKQTGVSAFLTGNISEVEDQFQITVKLIDSETGMIVSQGSFRTPRAQLTKKQDEIAFGYIAQHGIGINWQTSYLFHPGSAGGDIMLNDFFVSYRPELWLNIKLGFTHIYFEMSDETKVNPTDLYPDYTNPLTGYDPNLKTGYTSGKINQTAPYIGTEYNYIISPSFTIGLGIGATIFMPDSLKFEQTFTGNPVRDLPLPLTTTAYVNNTMVLTQTFDPATMFRIEIKPQYFISPRATIGLYLAATYTTPLKVQRADFGDGVAIYPNEPEGRIDPGNKHLGFNAKQIGLDKNSDVEQDLLLMGCAVGLSVSFYF